MASGALAPEDLLGGTCCDYARDEKADLYIDDLIMLVLSEGAILPERLTTRLRQVDDCYKELGLVSKTTKGDVVYVAFLSF